MIKTIEYVDGVVIMIDQTRLPLEKVFVNCKTIEDVGQAIKTMRGTCNRCCSSLRSQSRSGYDRGFQL